MEPSTEERLNQTHHYFARPRSQVEQVLVQFLGANAKVLEAELACFFKVVNVRAVASIPTGDFGPTSWHFDGSAKFLRKILIYPQTMSLEAGSVEVYDRHGASTVINSDEGAALLCDTSILLHRGRPGSNNAAPRPMIEVTRENAQQARGVRPKLIAEQLHDKVLFMANTGLRPDEMNQLQYRDVEITEDEDSGETILLIEVRGKRGVGYCKSTTGAVFPFQRLVQRNQPLPNDLVFPFDHKKGFNRILGDLDLKVDRQGNQRTFYSLRHSYISFRLLEGADIYQVAKNCRTSVEMIEQHYAIHLKNAIDASAVNRRRAPRSTAAQTRRAELNPHLG